jgi:hypothetical protein
MLSRLGYEGREGKSFWITEEMIEKHGWTEEQVRKARFLERDLIHEEINELIHSHLPNLRETFRYLTEEEENEKIKEENEKIKEENEKINEERMKFSEKMSILHGGVAFGFRPKEWLRKYKEYKKSIISEEDLKNITHWFSKIDVYIVKYVHADTENADDAGPLVKTLKEDTEFIETCRCISVVLEYWALKKEMNLRGR